MPRVWKFCGFLNNAYRGKKYISTFYFFFAFAEQDDLKRRNAYIWLEFTIEDTICVGKPINRHAGNQL